jgi:hypothetical protein
MTRAEGHRGPGSFISRLCSLGRRAETAPAHPVVPDKTNSVPILNKRILTGDLSVDGHEDPFFSQQLE